MALEWEGSRGAKIRLFERKFKKLEGSRIMLSDVGRNGISNI